ncbi:MAG: BBP7 family outer membrane beta-barrel protein [Planctomycetaceae bacterium]|nr:BBP7 family outer membrane beta-barrel protein [Planctomycetaceae bacterium]
MADRAFRILATAMALAVLSLTNTSQAASPVSRSVADSYGTATAPALSIRSSGSAAMDLWNEEDETSATASSASGNSPNSCCACGNWCAPNWYGQADLLIWWFKGNQVPALVTTSPDGTPRAQAGVLGEPGTEILMGGSGIDDNYRPGVRLTVGRWLDDCQINGLEATWFSVGDGANSGNFFAESVGTPLSPILARPFYNINLAREDAQLVAFEENGNGVIEGSVWTETNSELHSVAVLLRHNLSNDRYRRFDLVGGYRYLRFRESLAIGEFLNSTDPGGVVPVGTTFGIRDEFTAENDFHGGEFGLDTLLRRGCWDINILTKVAVGNMHQSGGAAGQTTITTPGGVPLVNTGGLLALPTNIGRSSWDEFAIIPELALNLRYRWSERLSFAAGYSLLWVTDVARSGGQIDRVVNTTQLPSEGGILVGPARPAPEFGHTDMWLQGLNLGAVFEF